jgi:hypothetical protein
MLLAAITWLGQDFGAILTGQGTDPNSGPLLFLLALAYWPLRPQPAALPAATTPRPLPLLRVGIVSAAAALIAASSVAAATGLTTATATASVGHRTLTFASSRMLGPGAVRSSYRLAGYRVLFDDLRNRATRPGTVSIALLRRGQPVHDAYIALSYRSLDMRMPTRAVSLQQRGPGSFRGGGGPFLGMGGRWRITISIRPPRGPELELGLTDLIAR